MAGLGVNIGQRCLLVWDGTLSVYVCVWDSGVSDPPRTHGYLSHTHQPQFVWDTQVTDIIVPRDHIVMVVKW